jgi:hypothetical protein
MNYINNHPIIHGFCRNSLAPQWPIGVKKNLQRNYERSLHRCDAPDLLKFYPVFRALADGAELIFIKRYSISQKKSLTF